MAQNYFYRMLQNTFNTPTMKNKKLFTTNLMGKDINIFWWYGLRKGVPCAHST